MQLARNYKMPKFGTWHADAIYRVPTPGESWIVIVKFPGPGKSWEMILVLKSPRSLSYRSWKVLEFAGT